MSKHVYRFITLVAVCSMFAAVLTYSRAMAENPSDLDQASNVCMLDTDETSAVDEAPVSSLVPAADDVVVNACNFGSCNSRLDCPKDHFAAPFFCANNCCVPF